MYFMDIGREKLELKIDQFDKAVNRLGEAATAENSEQNFELDSTIQRFEFSVELAWKLMKLYLEQKGVATIATPLDAVKEAYAAGLITDGDKWAEMLRARNVASHTYDQDNAFDLYSTIKSDYYKILANFAAKMASHE